MKNKENKMNLHIGYFLNYYGETFLDFTLYNKEIDYFYYTELIQILLKENGNKI